MGLDQEPSRGWSTALRLSDAAIVGMLILVAIVAAIATFAVHLFEKATETLFHVGYHWLPEWLHGHGYGSWMAFILYPVVLGLIVAGVKRLVSPKDRQHSVPLVIISLVQRSGILSPISTLLKTVGSILTLGAGGSLGREGPVVLLGSGLGSSVGQIFRLGPERMNILVAAGACAAIGTAFHAPITGVFFVMEMVLIQFSARSFALLAVAAAVAAQLTHLLEVGPAFPIPAYRLSHPIEIIFYLGLGLLVTPAARMYIETIYGSEDLIRKVKALPGWVKPAIGGILFGAVALLLPQTLGGGYDTISEALAGNLPLALLVGLLAAKLVTIALTSGFGWPGGTFAPAMFLGAVGGGAYGKFFATLFPQWIPAPGAYSVVGMAAMIAAATQAPLTAVMLIFEVTRDYGIALPAMLACGVAAVFSQRFSPYSIDTLHLSEHGVLLPWEFHDLRGIRVADVMTRDVHKIRANMLVKDVIGIMQQHRHGGFPVLNEEERLVGMVTLADIRAIPLKQRLATLASVAMSKALVVVTPEQTVADAARLMARKRIGRVPVVDRHDPKRLVGILSRSDILRAYPNDEVFAHEEGE